MSNRKPFASASTIKSKEPFASVSSTDTSSTKGKRTTDTEATSESTSKDQQHEPKLLVFDLDNTIWTPELYQIRQSQCPIVEKDIQLFPDIQAIMKDLRQRQQNQKKQKASPIQVAIASRTNKGKWANQLLYDFSLDKNLPLIHMFDQVVIETGSKTSHFRQLKDATGIPYHEMLFFDDDMHLNLKEVSQLGVMCCHCPKGMSYELYTRSIAKYRKLSMEREQPWMGYIVNDFKLGIDGAIEEDEGRRTTGQIKFYNKMKRFGFVQEEGTKKEFFFHESKVAAGMFVEKGMMVEFDTAVDGRGRACAIVVSSLKKGGPNKPFASTSNRNNTDKITTSTNERSVARMPCFSMSQPFCSLLIRGVKTVETRNNPMFLDIPDGTKILLHCGRRDWRDMDAPRRELLKAGYSEKEIDKLFQLPIGFSRGSIVGMLTVGKTYQASDRERRQSQLQRQVVAGYNDVGQFCTPIKEAQWLKHAFPTRGNPGIYDIDLPTNLLPSEA